MKEVFKFSILIWFLLFVAGCGGGGGSENGGDSEDNVTNRVEPPNLQPPLDPQPPAGPPAPVTGNPFEFYNNLEPRDWWRRSEPYSCNQRENPDSPWREAGLMDLGGSDPLSLIRYFGNGSYFRYGGMFNPGLGCTLVYSNRYPELEINNLDWPIDSTYYSLGDLDIYVDVARVPPDASGWDHLDDDGARVDFSMEEAVALLNQHVAAYYRRISQNKLRITFHAGREFTVGGDGGFYAMKSQQFRLAGASCVDDRECGLGDPSGLNRILLNDVEVYTGGIASGLGGWALFGLVSVRDADMQVIVHEMGHGWMGWPHSFTELFGLRLGGDGFIQQHPNVYSNFYDMMSSLDPFGGRILGWDVNMPSTLAINRYSAGWIRPEDVALHLEDSATYTLSKPFEEGKQFLVIHSGRSYAFTTLEVLEERSSKYRIGRADVYTPGGTRPRRYEGVLVSRYDQSSGTGTKTRFGPALYDRNNPWVLLDVWHGADDYSLIPHGETRDIGGGVSVGVTRNSDGSYQVTVSGGKVAQFPRWCNRLLFPAAETGILEDEYDTGCLLSQPLRDK